VKEDLKKAKLSDFEFVSKLGKGSFGEVHKVKPRAHSWCVP